MTNSVSSTGRIGAPTHYVNATEENFELFRQTIPTQIAFALLTENREVTWVSDQAILVKLHEGSDETAQLMAIAASVRVKAEEIFRAASVSESGFHSWLARGLCTFQVVDAWPEGNVIHAHEVDFSHPEFPLEDTADDD